MKLKYSIYLLMAGALVMPLTSCNDMLDKEPDSRYFSGKYLWDESQLDAYALGCYGYLPWNNEVGPCASDNSTDIQAGMGVSNVYVNNLHKVGQTGGAWGFGEIYNCNYFLNIVVPRYEAGELSGNEENIRHYIGEMYFFRALNYFNKLRSVGDFPCDIICSKYFGGGGHKNAAGGEFRGSMEQAIEVFHRILPENKKLYIK